MRLNTGNDAPRAGPGTSMRGIGLGLLFLGVVGCVGIALGPGGCRRAKGPAVPAPSGSPDRLPAYLTWEVVEWLMAPGQHYGSVAATPGAVTMTRVLSSEGRRAQIEAIIDTCLDGRLCVMLWDEELARRAGELSYQVRTDRSRVPAFLLYTRTLDVPMNIAQRIKQLGAVAPKQITWAFIAVPPGVSRHHAVCVDISISGSPIADTISWQDDDRSWQSLLRIDRPAAMSLRGVASAEDVARVVSGETPEGIERVIIPLLANTDYTADSRLRLLRELKALPEVRPLLSPFMEENLVKQLQTEREGRVPSANRQRATPGSLP